MNLKAFKKDLKELLVKYNVGLEVVLEGDTHGVDAEFVAYDLDSDKTYMLNNYSTTLAPYDLGIR